MLPYPRLHSPTGHVRPKAGSKAKLLMLSHMLCILSGAALMSAAVDPLCILGAVVLPETVAP